MALFGCAPHRPLDYSGSAGLLWAMNGGRLLELHRRLGSYRCPSHQIAAHLFPSKCGCGENRFALDQKNRASRVKRLRSSGGRWATGAGIGVLPRSLRCPSLGKRRPGWEAHAVAIVIDDPQGAGPWSSMDDCPRSVLTLSPCPPRFRPIGPPAGPRGIEPKTLHLRFAPTNLFRLFVSTIAFHFHRSVIPTGTRL
jgi:hypothetical protein